MKRINFGKNKAAEIKDEITNGTCYYCGCQLPEDTIRTDERGTVVSVVRNWHLDHYVPLSRGGEDSVNNLVPACKECNLHKSNKTGNEFFEQGC